MKRSTIFTVIFIIMVIIVLAKMVAVLADKTKPEHLPFTSPANVPQLEKKIQTLERENAILENRNIALERNLAKSYQVIDSINVENNKIQDEKEAIRNSVRDMPVSELQQFFTERYGKK